MFKRVETFMVSLSDGFSDLSPLSSYVNKTPVVMVTASQWEKTERIRKRKDDYC